MKWATIWAIEDKVAWQDMKIIPYCPKCPGEAFTPYHKPICSCKVPENWVWPHEVCVMLLLIRHKRLPDWWIKE